jgi:hypothetical protein
VTSAPIAHVGGIPIEETLASFGPPLLVAFGVAWAKLRARLRPVRAHARTDPTHSNPERPFCRDFRAL